MRLTRRAFLKALSLGAAGVLCSSPRHAIAEALGATTQPHKIINAKSRVVFAQSERLLRNRGLNRRYLSEMIAASICELTGHSTCQQALKSIFRPDDVIGFKFDPLVDHMLKINQPVCEEIYRLFLQCGFSAENLLFIDVEPDDDTLPEHVKVPFGWGAPVRFGNSASDQFAAVLDKVTALVNVAQLRAHSVGSLYGCLANVTYGLMRHPGQFYGQDMATYIADIYKLPLIGPRVRLNIINSLKVLIRPDLLTESNAMVEHRSMLVGFDPVAVDSAGFQIIDQLRHQAGLDSLLKPGQDFPPCLFAAARNGLGHYHPDQVELKTLILN